MAKCARPTCLHYHSDIDGICLTKACACTPELFLPVNHNDPGFKNFEYYTKVLATHEDVHQKVKWLLEALPATRNMPDWEFIATYWKYAIRFMFGETWSQEWFDKINMQCQPETIRRAKQKVCHEELETLRIFQEMLKELEKEERDGRPEYWKLTEQMKKFWTHSKYVPTDWDLLRKKLIKENAIFQYSIEELNSIC